MQETRRVVVCSPYGASTKEELQSNIDFARNCCLDCISRKEVPFAPHLFFTQFLDDSNLNMRKMGMELGYEFWDWADLIVFYIDFGISAGMQAELVRAFEAEKPFQRRLLRKKAPVAVQQSLPAELEEWDKLASGA